MSKIQDAIKRLRQEQELEPKRPATPPRRHDNNGRPVVTTAVGTPAVRRKVRFDGAQHHVDLHHLVEAGLLVPRDSSTAVADEFRRIKRPLIELATGELKDSSEHMNVIMITSAMPGAGKTFCSMNLAASIANEREINVMLVDADVAKPHISREFGLAEHTGLIDLLVDDGREVDEGLVHTDFNDILVLPAGRYHAQATELLASDRMSSIVHEVATRYPDRLIIMDSPPLLITSEAHVLAKQVGQIALVVESGETSHHALAQATEMLDPDAAINLILNKSRHLLKSSYYGDRYGSYGYYGFEGA